MSAMALYRIHTKGHCHPAKGWFADFESAFMCPECWALDLGLRSKGVDVWLEEKPPRYAINSVRPPGVGIAQVDFLSLFKDEVSRLLVLGRVFDQDGAEIEGLVTFVAHRPLPLRGGHQSTHSFCPKCGRFRYSAANDWYVVKNSLTGAPLYECRMGGLVVTEDLYRRVDRKAWKGIYVTKVPVKDEPEDGITDFPENYYYRGPQT
ncbi:MAG TPA: hypothetical protein PLL20_19790 [Phycisphaerae bacterium]|nr:hypothetical protein [Phycisphaerae bacterium]